MEHTCRDLDRQELEEGGRVGVHVVLPDEQGLVGTPQVQQQDVVNRGSSQEMARVHCQTTCLAPTQMSVLTVYLNIQTPRC